MNVGDLRRVLAPLPNDMQIVVEAWAADEVSDGDVVQVALQIAKVESRCDEIDALYLSGDARELQCDACMRTTGGQCSEHAEPENEER